MGNQQTSLQRPTVKKNVSEGCSSTATCPEAKCPAHSDCKEYWEHSSCSCHSGWVGLSCSDVCEYDPCENRGRCVHDSSFSKGYLCSCDSDEYSGKEKESKKIFNDFCGGKQKT